MMTITLLCRSLVTGLGSIPQVPSDFFHDNNDDDDGDGEDENGEDENGEDENADDDKYFLRVKHFKHLGCKSANEKKNECFCEWSCVKETNQLICSNFYEAV